MKTPDRIDKPMTFTAACGVAIAAATAFATTAHVVSWENTRLNLTDKTGDTVTLSTSDHSAYPSGLPTPSFWIDSSDTGAWSVDAASGQISRIPSKVGSRVLTNDFANASWTGWNTLKPVNPLLTYDAELGEYVLDFGKYASRKCLIFDAEQPDDCTPTNKLSSIGTMIAVYGAQENGGWIFGGGDTSMIAWHRSTAYLGNTKWCAYNPICHSVGNVAKAFYYGYTRHDGFSFIPYRVGFNGGWEVFTFSAQTDADAATLAATGLGIGDGRPTEPDRSGGMKIAEMIIYPTVLTREQIVSVEDWLRQKWFGTSAAGVNGRARVDEIVKDSASGAGVTATITINAGETLELGMLEGGRNSKATASTPDVTSFTGGGTLKLQEGEHYSGQIALNGVTMSFEKRPIPTLDQLPAGLHLRFDPSDADSLTTVDTGTETVVTDMRNQVSPSLGATEYNLKATRGAATCTDKRPLLAPNASPTGLTMLDFGPWGCWNKNAAGFYIGRYMSFTPSSPLLTTAIAVIDTRRGGGWLMNGGFCRQTQSGGSVDTAVLCTQDSSHLVTSNKETGVVTKSNNVDKQNILAYDPEIIAGVEGCAYIDGERVGYNGTIKSAGSGKTYKQYKGYPNNRFIVVALQVPGADPGYVGGYNEKVCGGLILGEMLCWARPLNEQEIRDASAYLAKRWLGRTLPGYAADGDANALNVQNLTVAAPSTVYVAAGVTARVDTVSLNADLVKTGAGVLALRAYGSGSSKIIVREGDVTVEAAPTPATFKTPAVNPAVAFDPTSTNGWLFETVSDKLCVSRVQTSGSRRKLSSADASYMPFVNFTDGPEVKGKPMPVVDFGDPNGESGVTANSYALYFDHPVSGTRSVYSVWLAKEDCSAFFMGSATASACGVSTTEAYDWHRGMVNGACKNGSLLGGSACSAVKNGMVYTNGAVCAATSWNPSGTGWHLIEAHTTDGVHVSAFGADRGSGRVGGIMMGETLIYDRVLTEQEKVATRNYLMQKWFGKTDDELEQLPDPTPAGVDIGRMQLDEDTTLTVDEPVSVKHLSGASDLVKQGDATLSLSHMEAYTGTVHVAAGTLKLVGRQVTTSAALPQDGLLLRLDAEQGVTTTDDGAYVTNWASANGSGWKAVSAKGTHGKVTVSYDPSYVSETLFEGRKTVDMVRGSCFKLYNPAGEWAAITNVRSALWVLGSKRGGGLLLGGGDHTGAWISPEGKHQNDPQEMYYAWHRGSYHLDTQSAGNHWQDPLLASNSKFVSNGAQWRVNGTAVSVSAEEVLSGSWDLVSTRLAAGYYAPTDALAVDGRNFADQAYTARIGNQALAELLVYTNRLSDTDLIQAEEYLGYKWGLGFVDNRTTQLTVDVAAGTTLDCDGKPKYVYGLAGEGTIDGDVTVTVFNAEKDGAGVTVNGTLTFNENPVFALTGLPDAFHDLTVNVATATAYEGLDNLAGATVTGAPSGYVARAKIKDGKLVIRVHRRRGTCILFY